MFRSNSGRSNCTFRSAGMLNAAVPTVLIAGLKFTVVFAFAPPTEPRMSACCTKRILKPVLNVCALGRYVRLSTNWRVRIVRRLPIA